MYRLVHVIFAGLLVGCLALASSAPARAASRDSDYVSLAVPDLARARAFFDDVLGCEALNGGQDSKGRVVLLCGAGDVVELTPSQGRTVADESGPIRLSGRDVAHADRWLRRGGVRVMGSTLVTRGTGAQSDTTIVNFMTPWGQHLQLIERDSNSRSTAAR